MAKSCSVCGMFGGLLRPSWSLSVALSLLLVSLCAGQFIPDTDTLRWITNTYQSTMDEMVKKEGVYIRTRWNDGCLDSGCCSIGFRQVTFNQDCPRWGWMKWSFEGPMLIVHKPFIQMCLECQDGNRDSVVGTARCTGSRQQHWHFNMYHDKRTAQGDISFTISSSLHQDQCLTIDESSQSGGLVLRNCLPGMNQLFYLNRDWFRTAIASQAIVDSSQSSGLKLFPLNPAPAGIEQNNSTISIGENADATEFPLVETLAGLENGQNGTGVEILF